MSPTAQELQSIDWSALPAPDDDGGTAHLESALVPAVSLRATDGSVVTLSSLEGRTVVFAYPRTGVPGEPLPHGWDLIPGARGCTPHACAFRDLYAELRDAGAAHVFGLSTQSSSYQQELVHRLHLPFAILSDSDLRLTSAMKLPTMSIDGVTLIRRLAMVIDDSRVTKVFYPVFPPDRNAGEVLAWLKGIRS